MVTPELAEFVRQQITAGIAKEEVAAALASQGWNAADIAAALGGMPAGSQTASAPAGAAAAAQRHTASIGLRFFNMLLDWVLSYVLSIPIFMLLGSSAMPSLSAAYGFSFFLGFAWFACYYILMESIWQRTPAKWITKTKVVNLDGTKPGVGRIIARSLCRYIPFDALSFLFGKYPFGWHDSISGTMVVPAEYTVQDAASVNPRDKGKGPAWVGIIVMGLVLIPIIGIAAGIVLASLGEARAKTQHARDQMLQLQMRNEEEIRNAQNSASLSGSTTTETPGSL